LTVASSRRLKWAVGAHAAGGESVFGLIDSASEQETGTREIERAVGTVRFRDVGFFYANTPAAALVSVHLDIRAGELIALVGPSGAARPR